MAPQDDLKELKCSSCGEVNPLQFELCWNCGRSLSDAERVAPLKSETDDAENLSDATQSKRGVTGPADWFELIGVLLASCAHLIIWRAIYGRAIPEEASVSSVLISVPVYVGWLILLWLLVRRDGRMQQPAPLSFHGWYWELFFAVLIVGAAWVVSFATAILANDFRLPQAEPQIFVQITSFKLAAIYGVMWSFAVAYEEVLFRVYLQAKLELLLGETILPILISAIIFAAAHGYPPRGALHQEGH